MKRYLAALLAAVLIFMVPGIHTYAAESSASAQPGDQVEQKESELEKKYGVEIKYSSTKSGKAAITINSLEALDMALENVTADAVKQLSEHYKKRNGTRLTFRFLQNNQNLSGNFATTASFDPETSLIEIYYPSSGGNAIISGEAPITIVHELGHALHFMYTDSYGFEKMRRDWSAFNGSQGYDDMNIMENPSENVFISAYAATTFEEDVAETIGQTFIRAKAGQGFKNLLSANGKKTGLGKKVAYVEKMLASCFGSDSKAIESYRRIYDTATTVRYQNIKLSGDYLQYIGYPQPRNILNGTLRGMGIEKNKAVWIRSIGGWYVLDKSGNEIVVFPGNVWFKVPSGFKAPKAAA